MVTVLPDPTVVMGVVPAATWAASIFKLLAAGVAVPVFSVKMRGTAAVAAMVTVPPRLTGDPVTVMPVPSTIVMGFETTFPAVTVKFVALNEATPSCVEEASIPATVSV
jgi:hypothetical protein